MKNEGTPGWAGEEKEGDTPCTSTSGQTTEVAEERRQLASVNPNYNWRTCVPND